MNFVAFFYNVYVNIHLTGNGFTKTPLIVTLKQLKRKRTFFITKMKHFIHKHQILEKMKEELDWKQFYEKQKIFWCDKDGKYIDDLKDEMIYLSSFYQSL